MLRSVSRMSVGRTLLDLLRPGPRRDDQERGGAPQWPRLIGHLEREAPAELARWAAVVDAPSVLDQAARGRRGSSRRPAHR